MRHGGEYRLALASGFSPESIRFAPEFPTDAELAVPAADLVLDDGGLLLRLEGSVRCLRGSACGFGRSRTAASTRRRPRAWNADGRAAGYGAGAAAQGCARGRPGRHARPWPAAIPRPFPRWVRALFTCAAALHDSFGLQVSYCCLGGGLLVAHRRTERDADIAAVSRGCRRNFPGSWSLPVLGGVPVETGLGRWLTAHAGILLTTVTGVKRGAQDWLGGGCQPRRSAPPGALRDVSSYLRPRRRPCGRAAALCRRRPHPGAARNRSASAFCRNAAEARVLSSMTSGLRRVHGLFLWSDAALRGISLSGGRHASLHPPRAAGGRSYSPRSTKPGLYSASRNAVRASRKPMPIRRVTAVSCGGNAAEFSLAAARRGLLGQIGGQIDHGIHEHALLFLLFFAGQLCFCGPNA